jgi:hypothetical protein
VIDKPPGLPYTITFDSGQYQSHLPLHRVVSRVTVMASHVVRPDWRRWLAHELREIRFACRRLLRPETGLEFKKPKQYLE